MASKACCYRHLTVVEFVSRHKLRRIVARVTHVSGWQMLACQALQFAKNDVARECGCLRAIMAAHTSAARCLRMIKLRCGPVHANRMATFAGICSSQMGVVFTCSGVAIVTSDATRRNANMQELCSSPCGKVCGAVTIRTGI